MPFLVRAGLDLEWTRFHLQYLPWDEQHRLRIWDFATERWMQRPILGWGFDSARLIPGSSDQILGVPHLDYAQKMPLHPHNGILQIWLETGAIGAVLAAGALAALALRLARFTDRWMLAAATGAIASFLVQTSLSFGMWQNWWLAVAVLAFTFVRLIGRTAKSA